MNNSAQIRESLRARLLGLREPESGVWTGELASSALATALAAAALDEGDADDRRLAARGADWLAGHGNADGGWGDTPESASNLSTTLIAAGALRRAAARGGERAVAVLERADAWVAGRVGGNAAPEPVARALGRVYGEDRTFAVPILAFLAMCGSDAGAWRSVPPLPFLLALLPMRLYRFFRMQVVSYALPALIAVGLCRHVCAARARCGWAWGRLFAGPLLRRLERLQPAHGGFLDAVPLTAFVCLALQQAGYGRQAVVSKGLAFLRRSARANGSWAIDSNLRTWVTALATRSLLCEGGAMREAGRVGELERIAHWLVRTQLRRKHPFTGARPGGWAWTDLPGGMPDADDTSGALIALKRLKSAGCATDVSEAVRSGLRWLLELQNADGGMPTFCKGWGRLPFDRSCPDISAHALAALAAWAGGAGENADPPAGKRPAGGHPSSRVAKGMDRLVWYLARSQEPDGSWLPLWFGHQEGPGGKNPVIGTARVVDALREAQRALAVDEAETAIMNEDAARTKGLNGGVTRTLNAQRSTLNAEGVGSGALAVGRLLARGERWLLDAQREDGGWGMGREATVEETALAVIALSGGGAACAAAAGRGRSWLAGHWEEGCARPAPIGLYFALLWYHERLYPLVWAHEALGRDGNETAARTAGVSEPATRPLNAER